MTELKVAYSEPLDVPHLGTDPDSHLLSFVMVAALDVFRPYLGLSKSFAVMVFVVVKQAFMTF